MVAGVFVPEPFDRLGPVGDLLGFVERQYRPDLPTVPGKQSGTLPLCSQPGGVAEGWFVGSDKDVGSAGRFQHLMHHRGLAYLTWARHHMQKTPRFCQPSGENGSVFTLERGTVSRVTHCNE